MLDLGHDLDFGSGCLSELPVSTAPGSWDTGPQAPPFTTPVHPWLLTSDPSCSPFLLSSPGSRSTDVLVGVDLENQDGSTVVSDTRDTHPQPGVWRTRGLVLRHLRS